MESTSSLASQSKQNCELWVLEETLPQKYKVENNRERHHNLFFWFPHVHRCMHVHTYKHTYILTYTHIAHMHNQIHIKESRKIFFKTKRKDELKYMAWGDNSVNTVPGAQE